MNIESRFLTSVGAVVMVAGAVLFAQGGDANKVMAEMRQALGGEKKLAAVKSLSATGKNQRAMGAQSIQGDYEMALELPDRFFTKQVMAQTPLGSVSLTVGFNGSNLIQDTEVPQMPGGGMRIQFGGAAPNATPEERGAADVRQVTTQKQEFARMTLGMFGGSTPAYPVEFTYGGVAESPDGKADIINVKGEGDFTGKLFVDQKSHLPLMFSWMAKEPLQISQSAGPGGRAGQPNVMQFSRGGGAAPSQEERDKMMKDLQEQMKVAETNRKIVEYRVFYSDYQAVDGLQLPHRFQQAIDGNTSSEITIEKYRINPKIDPKRFEPKK